MKMLKLLMAALLLVAMAAPAIAEDRLSLSGEMRVRAFAYDYDYDYEFEGEKENDSDSGAWNDQRLRIAGKIAVAEGVSVNFRLDATESNENSSDAVAWGGAAGAYQYAQRRADIQFDLAYLQIEKFGATLKAGQLYFGGFGYTGKLIDVVGAGFTGMYNGITLHHVKRKDENMGKNTFSGNYDADASLTAVKYDFKGEGFTLTPMVSYNNDATFQDRDLLGLGLAGSVNAGPVLIKGEFDYFDGDYGDYSDVDMFGTQLYLDASMAATDTVRVGGMLFYALGDDEDEQVTNNNFDGNVNWAFADYHPESYGTWTTDFVDEFYDIYDPAGVNAGVIAFQAYADVKASDSISLQFAAMYFQNEDDTYVDYDGYTLNAGIVYALAANTSLTAHVNYIDIDAEDNVDEFDASEKGNTLQMISGIQVKF
jgi:hypothetical protein